MFYIITITALWIALEAGKGIYYFLNGEENG